MGNWKILTPRDAENLFTDPSAERGALGSGFTIAGLTDPSAKQVRDNKQFRGALSWYSLDHSGTNLMWFAGSDGGSKDLPYLASGQTYTFSCYIYMPTPIAINWKMARLGSGFGGGPYVNVTNVLSQVVNNTWSKIVVTFTPAVTDYYYIGFDKTYGGNADVWTDAWMLVKGTEELEYFDGDTEGVIWTGVPHMSTSLTTIQNMNTGVWIDVEDTYGIIIKATENSGVAKLNNQTLEQAQTENARFLRMLAQERDLNMTLWISGETFPEMMSVRKALVKGWQPGRQFWLKYVGLDKDVKIKVIVESGLELKRGQGYVEQPVVTLKAYNPYWTGNEESHGKECPLFKTQACAYILRRKPNGTWERLGSLNGVVNSVHVSRFNGRVYIGGAFTQDTVTTDLIKHAGYWDENLGKFVTLSATDPGVTNAIAADVDGNVKLATDANGICTWTRATSTLALGAGGPYYALAIDQNGSIKSQVDMAAPNLPVRGLAIDQNGIWYAVGDFTTIGGLGIVRAGYSTNGGVSWIQMGSGLSAIGRCVFITPAGDIYVGGQFTSSGSILISNVAKFNGNVFVPLGSGISDSSLTSSVYAMAMLKSGNIIMGGILNTAGGFRLPQHNAGGVTQDQRLCEWTGSVYIPADAIPPVGNNQITSLDVAPDGTLYVAFNGTGTAYVANTQLLNNPGLGVAKPDIHVYYYNLMGSVYRIDNYTTGKTIAFRALPAFNPHIYTDNRANPLVIPMRSNGDPFVVSGSNPASFELDIGDNYISVFGVYNTATVPDWPASAQVWFQDRHIGIEGGAL